MLGTLEVEGDGEGCWASFCRAVPRGPGWGVRLLGHLGVAIPKTKSRGARPFALRGGG